LAKLDHFYNSIEKVEAGIPASFTRLALVKGFHAYNNRFTFSPAGIFNSTLFFSSGLPGHTRKKRATDI